jgi:hypothetical protein
MSGQYEEQLAARAAELLPGARTAERLELLGVMDPDDMRTSLAWLASHAPQMFDFALVRDRALVERLRERLDNISVSGLTDFGPAPVSAELAARRTAAAAVLADYQRAAVEGADVADRALWAARLADMLGALLGAPGDLAAAGPAGQLEEIRLVLEAFDWETDDRQYALEQIDGILHQGPPDHVCPAGTLHFSDHGEIYAAHPDGTAHVVGRSPQ